MQSDVSYVEIGAADAAKARAFLEQLFGWASHPFGNDSDGWFQTPSMKVGVHGNDPNPGFLVFFGVPDLEAAMAKVRALGGEAATSIEESGFGRFCICTDPQGMKFGIHQQ
jgi:hypothetical protein